LGGHIGLHTLRCRAAGGGKAEMRWRQPKSRGISWTSCCSTVSFKACR